MEIVGYVLVVNAFYSCVITVTEIILMHDSEHFVFDIPIPSSSSSLACPVIWGPTPTPVERSATVALFDLSAQKRKSSEKVLEVSPKKQRVSWPTAASSDVSHVVYRRGGSIGSNKIFATSVGRVPSTSAVSLCDGRQAGRSRNDPHSAPLSKTVAANYGSKSTRRPHISSWSADDVFAFAFVLSTPHASIYAKVSCRQARSVDIFKNFIV